jgi:hypothetical protein
MYLNFFEAFKSYKSELSLRHALGSFQARKVTKPVLVTTIITTEATYTF